MQLENMKCRNCGGELDYSKAVNGVLTCEFCGSKFTVPKSGANEEIRHFLLTGEHELDVGHFDEAATAYAKAAELDPNEPEAFFGLALAAAQVMHLKDEVNNRLQPICYSVSDRSFMQDTNFKRALSLATPEQKKEYQDKGKEIDVIREKFKEFRVQGLSYDTFICVKVTEDGSSRHTEDSFIASKLYKELKNAGYSPFYSEEECHDRQGEDYEAMILYALYSATSMLLVCSDESYLQTKWVKNEYSRFIKMQRDEEKAHGSLTVVFKGRVVERIPGLNGKVQGIDFNNFKALNLVLDFVQKFKRVDVPTIKRKEYGQAQVNKIMATRQGVEKRKLATVAGGEVSVSDQAKLSMVMQYLQRKEFVYARELVETVIADNPANGEAYMLRFLADMSCPNEVAFQKSKSTVTSYDDFEKALASADKERSRQLYELLYSRVYILKNVEDYEEFIALPDSSPKEIGELTNLMYTKAKQNKDTAIFDAIINTVTDTHKYIEMNLEFMNMLSTPRSDYERRIKRKYCDNILSVDKANKEALWYKFTDENKSIFDVDKSVIEESLFAYGYNEHAVEELMQMCFSNASKKEADDLFDFVLTMIPEERNSFYLESIDKYIEAKLKLKKKTLFESITKYNEMLLAADNRCDGAYFNRVLIKNGFYNPIQLSGIVDKLMSDEDYKRAMMVYQEKLSYGSSNYYMTVIDELKKVNAKLSTSVQWRKYVFDNIFIRRDELSTCSKIIKEPPQEVAAAQSTPSTGSSSSGSQNSSSSSSSSHKGKHYDYLEGGPKVLRILGYVSLILFVAAIIITSIMGGSAIEEGGDIAVILLAGIINLILIISMEKNRKKYESGKVKGIAIGMLVVNIFLLLAVIGSSGLIA